MTSTTIVLQISQRMTFSKYVRWHLVRACNNLQAAPLVTTRQTAPMSFFLPDRHSPMATTFFFT